MRRFPATLAVAAAALAAVVLGIGAVGASAAADITVTAKLQSSSGDAAYHWQLRDRRNRVVGFFLVACGLHLPSTPAQQCTGTLAMPHGRVYVMGTITSVRVFSLTVVGSNGAYSRLRSGNVLVTRIPSNGRWLVEADLRT